MAEGIMTASFIIVFAILALPVYFIVRAVTGRGAISPHGQYICTHCNTRGEPKKIARGSFGLELGLWLTGLVLLIFVVGAFILVAALIYSLWRSLSPRTPICPSCGAQDMIRITTPRGQQLVRPAPPVQPVQAIAPTLRTEINQEK